MNVKRFRALYTPVNEPLAVCLIAEERQLTKEGVVSFK